MNPPPNVVVLGAVLAGLAAAHALAERGARVRVFERRGRAGGNVDTRVVVGDRSAGLMEDCWASAEVAVEGLASARVHA